MATPEAEPFTSTGREYKPKGENIEIDDWFPVYVSRPPRQVKNAVIMFSDVFGLRTGRHKEICDLLAQEGYLVACPDVFRCGSPLGESTPSHGVDCFCSLQLFYLLIGGGYRKWTEAHSWEQGLWIDVFSMVMPWMKSQGAKKFAALGFGWGGYAAMHCATSRGFVCCASFYTSMKPCCDCVGEDALKKCWDTCCPQLVVSTPQTSPLFHPGKEAQAVVDNVAPGGVWKLEEKMKHGYMTRADIRIPANREAVLRGYQMIVEFFERCFTPVVLRLCLKTEGTSVHLRANVFREEVDP